LYALFLNEIISLPSLLSVLFGRVSSTDVRADNAGNSLTIALLSVVASFGVAVVEGIVLLAWRRRMKTLNRRSTASTLTEELLAEGMTTDDSPPLFATLSRVLFLAAK
jgi:hypothetical protein